jgi:bifunctional UDP-N-acetylglucosamine pyrophosphorylase/glucosamine-1-phosphate N-acetyltransferase
MKSTKAKVAHELLDKPLVRWVVDAARAAGSDKIFTVVGHQHEQVAPLVSDTITVMQDEQRGTGHAIMIAKNALLENCAGPSLVVLCGDTPLITAETIAALVASQQQAGAALSVLSHIVHNPTGYGRIIRNQDGDLLAIVEEADAAEQQRVVQECNSGAYCFDLAVLLESLDELSCENAQGEYYLTDVVGICARRGLAVKAHPAKGDEAAGINTRVQLEQASRSMQMRINRAHMEAGVTMINAEMVWIGPDVRLENDIELLPLTILGGNTTVGSGCVLGPNTRVADSVIGCNCRIDDSILYNVRLEDEVTVGPRAFLRPETVMKRGSKAGTHVEIKNSVIGENSKVPHLSYLGDATLGDDVNIGAGSITCNYDGVVKNHTTIGDRAFIGSDTMLVAPVSLGSDVVTGAGSVITKDVPDFALALGRAEQTNKKGWTLRKEGKRK